MQITRKDIGYTIYSRLEEALRLWLRETILNNFGADWRSYIPAHVFGKAMERLTLASPEEIEDPLTLFEESDIPDLMEIVCYKKGFSRFVSDKLISLEKFRDNMGRLYELRCKIAHVRSAFSAIDLDLLIQIAKQLSPIIQAYKEELQETLESINSQPEKVVSYIPHNFFVEEMPSCLRYLTNLPPADYDPDGGFIGRKDDMAKVTKLILGDLHRVITIAGAGGVGKSALAHQICQNLLGKHDLPFGAIVWVSAKEEKLTVTGIEPIEPTLRNYGSVLDSILETFGWAEELNKPLKQKEESVEIILKAGDKGILLIIDNLETIRDERVSEFIKDLPNPNKVLITSRLGLGEVERRYPLKELSAKDAVTLLRTVAREKKIDSLAMLPDNVLGAYADKMLRYPLAIKWVVGQVALGKDINAALGDLTSSEGDVAKFCFEHIFVSMLDDSSRMILYALAANEKPLVRGVLSHLTDLTSDTLDIALRNLTIASLVIPEHIQSEDLSIETRYALLPLTMNYIRSQLKAHPDVHRKIRSKVAVTQGLIDEADRAGKQYRYSLGDMGAETEEEKIAATLAFTAYQKYQSGSYEEAINDFRRATEIAPHFSTIYRNWATMESNAGFSDKADELMRKATSLTPDDPGLWFVWGNMEKQRSKYDRACEYLKKGLTLDPNSSPILGALGEVEKRRGNYEEADKLINKALIGETVGKQRRHQMINLTSMADNLRRWSEELVEDNRREEALVKLQKAYDVISKATKLNKDDQYASDTLMEVSGDLARLLLVVEGIDAAIPFFKTAIALKPKRYKEMKITSYACLRLVEALYDSGRIEEATKYFNIGKKALTSDSRLSRRYKELGGLLSEERFKGKLTRVATGGDFGFIELEGERAQVVFLHIVDISPKISNDEFLKLTGSLVSFSIEKNQQGLKAKNARLLE